MASIKVNLSSPAPHVKPNEIYRGSHPARLRLQVQLRIASEPGQSALVKVLANEFIKYMADEKDAEPFSVAWIGSNPTASLNHLASGSANVVVTHHVAAGNIAIKQGVADRSVYAWRDHWLLVGPRSDPAGLGAEETASIHDQVAQIFLAAVETADSARPVKFLSRYDKSAANVKESSLWAAIGQTPWAHPHSSWYHQYPDSPLAALQAAAALGQYTLTERGTWFALDAKAREGMTVFNVGSDADDDLLLNPAHVVVGTHAQNKEMAEEFADWLVNWDGGQKVIENFEVSRVTVYTTAPTTHFTTPFTPPQSPLQKGGKYTR